ncbi:hypothetical protein MCHI_001958 [Candidatus Magnetoovum chiemensis]|nr:hypothetical protein MCHI_001958 [Candidatus Magnetoovum chiemensis]
MVSKNIISFIANEISDIILKRIDSTIEDNVNKTIKKPYQTSLIK